MTWGFWLIFIRVFKNLKNLHFDELPLTKVKHVWAKNVQRSYFWWHWILMQNLKEKWLVLSKMTWGIWQIFTKARLKVEKFGLLLGPFIESKKCMNSKFKGDLCAMTMKNDAKFEQKLTGQFKNDMRNLTIFDSITQKSQ